MDLLESGKGATYKTGTLEGVRTLAGYVSSSKHGPVRFVIALRGNNGAMRFELLKAIKSCALGRVARAGHAGRRRVADAQ